MKWLTTVVLTAITASAPITGVTVSEGRTPLGVMTPAAQIKTEHTNLLDTGQKPLTLLMKESMRKQALIAQKKARHAKLVSNTTKMNKAIKAVKSHVGKTWYVFAGSTPAGWDCSGLVLWTYKKLGIELYHSATAQARAGKVVKNPVPGDVVAFSYPGSSSTFHVGLYVGKGKMIHAYYSGTRTRYDSVHALGKYVKVRFIRIVDQLQPAA